MFQVYDERVCRRLRDNKDCIGVAYCFVIGYCNRTTEALTLKIKKNSGHETSRRKNEQFLDVIALAYHKNNATAM